MPGFLLHVGAEVICSHGANGGQVITISTNPRVLVGGQPVATQTDIYMVGGCRNSPPCFTVKWIVPASRVMVGGKPAILQTSIGVCQNAAQIPQGPPSVIMTQLRVQGS